jgi:hypothetical protein
MTKEINNEHGDDIQPSDNIRGDVSDNTDLSTATNPDANRRRLDSADLGASKPVPVAKPEPKRTLEHAIVKACGHSIDLRHPPTQANCEDCWRAFFASGFTSEIHNMLTEYGRAAVEKVIGKKVMKRFGEYLKNELMAYTPEEIAKVEPSIEGSVLDVGAEREASLGIR